MEKPDYKKIIYYAWPFLFLGFFIVLGWIYIKPLLPEDLFSFEKIKDKVSGIFKGEEEPVDPDEKYSFLYTHTNLKPKTVEELGLEEKFEKEANNTNSVTVKVKTVQELVKAVSNAQGGETIELEAGKYAVNLEIDKNITITGQGSSTILLAEDTEKSIIKASGEKFSLKNVQIKDSRIGLETYSTKAEVQNVKFANLSATACFAKDSELIFTDSYIYDSGSAIKTLNSFGEISKSIIKNNKKSGIELRNSKFKIQNNIITKNQSYGVFVDQDSEAVIEENFIDDNTGFEVRIEGEKTIYR